MKKRLFSFLMAITVALSSVPLESVSAIEPSVAAVESQEQLFEMEGGTIVGYKDKLASSITIPSQIGVEEVTDVKDFAFDANTYPNLKEVVVLGDSTIIGEKAFGYQVNGDGVYNRVDGFCVWGYGDSYAEDYAFENAMSFQKLATTISPIVSSEKNIDKLFVGCAPFYVTTIVDEDFEFSNESEASRDVIWSSEDPSLVSVSQYKWSQNAEGKWECTAQVQILSAPKSGATCKVYASTRSGIRQEISFTLKIPATKVSLDIDVYIPEEITYIPPIEGEEGEEPEPETITVYKKTKLPETAIDGNNIYLERGWYLESQVCKFTSDSSDDSVVSSMPSQQELISDVTELQLDPREDTTVRARLVSQVGKTKLFATTKSGQIANTYTINVVSSIKETQLFLNETEIKGLAIATKGYIGKLIVEKNPSDATEVIEWSSSNENIVKIAKDGTVTATEFGQAQITGYIAASKTGVPARYIKFSFLVKDKIKYNEMVFVEEPTSTKAVTSLNLLAGDEKRFYIYDPKCVDENKLPNESVVWKSSNPEIASVDSFGVVTTSKTNGGKVVITAKAESGVCCTLELNVYVAATNIDLKKTAYQKPAGQMIEFSYFVCPSTSNEFVNWISDDESAVQVVSNEKGPNNDGEYILKLKILKPTSGFVNVNGKTVASGVPTQVQIRGLTPIVAEKLSIKPSTFVREAKNGDGTLVYCVQKDETITLEASVFPSDSNDEFWWEISSKNSSDLQNDVEFSTNELTASIVLKNNIDVEVKCVSSSGAFTTCNLRGVVPTTNVDLIVNEETNIEKIQIEVGSKPTMFATIDDDSTDLVTWTLFKKSEQNEVIKTWECLSADEDGMFSYPGDAFDTPGDYVVRATAESGIYREVEIKAVVYIQYFDFVQNGSVVKSIAVCKGKKTFVSIDNILPPSASNSVFTWAENNELLYLEVSEDTKTVEIQGMASGQTDLLVTTNAGITYSLPVTVVTPATTMQIGGQNNANTVLVHPGKEGVVITVTLGPNDTSDIVSWTIDKEGVVSVEPQDSDGITHTFLVTATQQGDAVLKFETISGISNQVVISSKAVDISNATATISSVEYTGKPVEANIEEVYVNDCYLEKDVDYKVVGYENNVNAGFASVTIEGVGNYSGTLELKFEIVKKECDFEMEYQSSHEFNGSNITPSVVVKDTINEEEVVLVENVDYTIEYSKDCKDVGEYEFVVTLKGNYSGEKSGYYEIVPKPIASVTLKDASKKVVTTLPSKTYTGLETTQKFFLYDGSLLLTEGVDYYTEYENNVDAGVASMTIFGSGNYSNSSRIVKFAIKPCSLQNVRIKSIPKQTYTGSNHKPEVIVTRVVNGEKNELSEGEDFKVSYKNNKFTGEATVIITPGSNKNYAASKEAKFVILPKKVEKVKQQQATPSSVTLTWSKLGGNISGYAIYQYEKNSYSGKLVATTSKNSVTISKLKEGRTYYYVVKGYKKVGKTNYYGKASSKIKVTTTTKSPSIKSASQSKGKVTLSWGACKGASKYYVYYSTNGGKTYKKDGYTRNTKYKVSKKFKKNSKVCFKVSAIRNLGEKEYASKYSTVKKVTISY